MGLFGNMFGGRRNTEAQYAASNITASVMNEELIAVISAAVAGYEEEQYSRKLYIRKLDRTVGARPAWGVCGTNEAIDARRI